MVRNAGGGKPGSHGSKVILLSHMYGGSHHRSLSLLTRQRRHLNNREAGPSNTRGTELHSRTPPRCPFKGLTCQSRVAPQPVEATL